MNEEEMIAKIDELQKALAEANAKLASLSVESKVVKALHKAETILQVLEKGYLFVRNSDGLVRFRTHGAHDEHIESLNFIEPPKPILTGRGN